MLGALLILNAGWIGWQASFQAQNHIDDLQLPVGYKIINNLFLFLFTLELVVRFMRATPNIDNKVKNYDAIFSTKAPHDIDILHFTYFSYIIIYIYISYKVI